MKQNIVLIAIFISFFTLSLYTNGMDKPNIVLIMADDIGLGDIGYYHRKRTGSAPVVPTPNLDIIAQAGMRFSDAHSPASLCAPTRYSMLTGNYPDRSGHIFGVWTPEANSGIEPRSTTSARLAKQGGYDTAFFGKWGLGEVWTKKEHAHNVIERGARYFGFDYALELPDGIQNRPLAFYENQQWLKFHPESELKNLSLAQAQFSGRGGRVIDKNLVGDSHWDPSRVGPMLATKMVEYIHSKEESDKPFFIYYSTQSVHIPHTPPAQLAGKKIAGSTLSPWGDMIVELDVQVKMIVDALKQAGQYENTLLLFTSDNGGLAWDKKLIEAGHLSSNGFRDRKGSIHEGGHRVPFFAIWPKRIKENVESHQTIVAHDVVATIAALAQQDIDRSKILDAINLLPVLLNKPSKEYRDIVIHQSKFAPYFAVREGDWKLIISVGKLNDLDTYQARSLFNLKENPSENESQNQLANPLHAAKIGSMLAAYKKYRQENKPTVKLY